MKSGVGFSSCLASPGQRAFVTNMESWEKEARKIAEERVKASLILQTLALENKVTVSDDLVAAKIAELKDVYQKSPEALKSLKDPNVRMDIKNRMIIEAALDLLVKANS